MIAIEALDIMPLTQPDKNSEEFTRTVNPEPNKKSLILGTAKDEKALSSKPNVLASEKRQPHSTVIQPTQIAPQAETGMAQAVKHDFLAKK